MQKRDQNKLGGNVSGGASAPPAKRGRPFGSVNSNAAAVAAAVAAGTETLAPSTLLGPSLHIHTSFAGQFIETPFHFFFLICGKSAESLFRLQNLWF